MGSSPRALSRPRAITVAYSFYDSNCKVCVVFLNPRRCFAFFLRVVYSLQCVFPRVHSLQSHLLGGSISEVSPSGVSVSVVSLSTGSVGSSSIVCMGLYSNSLRAVFRTEYWVHWFLLQNSFSSEASRSGRYRVTIFPIFSTYTAL